jgi:hypothetical protein
METQLGEYGLGAVTIYPVEGTEISLDATTPDPSLGPCEPRLCLFGEHGPAILGACLPFVP